MRDVAQQISSQSTLPLLLNWPSINQIHGLRLPAVIIAVVIAGSNHNHWIAVGSTNNTEGSIDLGQSNGLDVLLQLS